MPIKSYSGKTFGGGGGLKALPFGLSTACLCFIKLVRPFYTRCRPVRDNFSFFIDDGISGHRTKHLACLASARHNSDLIRAGFVFRKRKFLGTSSDQYLVRSYHKYDSLSFVFLKIKHINFTGC